MKRLLLAFLFLATGGLQAYALENVTGKVRTVYGAPVFHSKMQKYYLDVSLINISKDSNFEFPLRLLVTSLSQSKASVYQPDGINDDKMPYYMFSKSDKKFLAPGESVGPRRIYFLNLKNGGLNFTSIVRISTPENTMNSFISGLELLNTDLMLMEFDDHAREVYGQALMTNPPDWPNLANMLKNNTYVPITDVMGKYEVRIANPDGEETYLIYLYKNSKGEWKIFMM